MQLKGQNLSVYSVSEVNALARTLLEGEFPDIWIEGEISGFKPYRSGHWYFALKDQDAEIRCVMFRRETLSVDFEPRDGARIRMRCRISLYEPRGGFQAIGREMQLAGTGELLAALAKLREKLAKEGLFDASRKQSLPSFPRHLAIITSPAGAALRDIARTLRLRCPLFSCTIFPVSVQGTNAAPEIVRAFQRISNWPTNLNRPRPDIVLLARGGGSLEDLWTFNLETVVRAIEACDIPVATGIGHETDTSLSDLAADYRAATPTAAAAAVSPDGIQIAQSVREGELRLGSRLRQYLSHIRRDRFQQWSERLRARHPERILRLAMQRGDELEERLRRTMNRLTAQQTDRHEQLHQRLVGLTPVQRTTSHFAALNELVARLTMAGERTRSLAASSLDALTSRMVALSPQATLERGYAILSRPTQGQKFGRAVTSIKETRPGDEIHAHLVDGQLEITVKNTRGNPS